MSKLSAAVSRVRASGSPRRLAVFAYALAIVTLIAVGSYWVEDEKAAATLRRRTLDNAGQHARQMADVVARQMEAILQGFDLTLLQLRETHRGGSAGQVAASVGVAIDALQDKSIQGLVITDAQGRIEFSSISRQQNGVFLGDRDYFTEQANAGDDRLVIGTPVRSRLLDSWSIPISRPLSHAGRFDGVIVIGITPAYFANRLIDPRLSQHDVVAVFHPDGSYLARNQLLDTVLGTRLSSALPFFGPQAPARGDLRLKAPVDGRQRIYAWQRVPGSTVTVLVGLDEASVVAPIESEIARSRRQLLAVSTLLLLLGGGLSALLLRTARQQKLLRESEARYRSAFDENSSIKLLIDPADGRIVDANEAATLFYGHSSDALLSMRIGDISCLSPVELGSFMAQARLHGRRQFNFVQRLASGETRQVETYSGPIEVRRRTLLFSVIHDVSDRHATEQQLKLAASMFAHTHEAIFYCDPAGCILDSNDAFSRLTGYDRAGATGKHFRFLDAGRQGPEFYTALWTALMRVGNWRGEVWLRNRAGEVLVELLNLSVITDQNGAASAYVGIFSDITSLKESERRLEQMAHFDALTALPNRILFDDRLQQALRSAARQHELLAVAFLDLDRFKPVNDRYGHQAGDDVLIAVAQRLRESVRSADTVCRLGGDEFVLLLRNLVSLAEAAAILHRVQEALSRPYRIAEEKIIDISASIGFACAPDDAEDAERLIALADEAMYAVKRRGGAAVARCAHAATPLASGSRG